MIKVYDMSSGKLLKENEAGEYDDEVLYSGYQPIVENIAELRLQTVEIETEQQKQPELPEDLSDADCESFINSQEHE